MQSDGNLDKLNFIIVVKGYLKNKDMVGYTWYPTASMSKMKYLPEDASKHKSRVHKLGFIEEFLHANVEYRFCEIVHQIWRLLPGILQLFWKTINTEEVNVWNE